MAHDENFILPEIGDCMTDGTCKNPLCPEHGDLGVWDGDEDLVLFLKINGVPICQLVEHGGIIGNINPITVRHGDLIEVVAFQGPQTDYETWREL